MKLRLLLSVFFAFWAFVSCTTTDNGCNDNDDCEFVSSSSGGGGGNSNGGGGDSSSSGGGGGNSSSGGGGGNGSWTGWPFDNSGEDLQGECPSYGTPIEIKYNNGGAPEVTNPYTGEVSVTNVGEHITVNLGAVERNLLLSGTAQNGSLKVYGDERVGLYLNGVRITNSSGPAINIQKSRRVNVCLVSSKENYLDGASGAPAPKDQEQAKGAFFSEKKLYFIGSGSLEVKARLGQGNGHAIAVDDDFEMDNGKIIISEAAGDGIHANYRIEVKGGVIKIASKGDGIQSERDSVIVSGGKILVKTTGVKSHGIVSEGSTSIREDAKVQISVLGNGSKGIKSTSWAEIKGGTVAIQASGDRDQNDADTSTAAGIKVGGDNAVDLFIEGGTITIKSPGSKAKGINTSGDIDMKDGNVDIEADDDGIKVHGTLKMSGGRITAVSRKSDAIDGDVRKTGGTINGN
ncbi:MAG: carbohydrate-binding domain-containing protein [Candidatus Fibromonas sp.]|jgi:hypothetical protein|nr:carbohydrate-binding domain-containing protein [Candidatus Fibromonas sp.]